MHRNTACALLQVLAVQERKPARLPRPFAALLSAPAGSAALAAATYAATGAAAMALLACVQHAGGAAVAADYSRLAGFGAAAGLTFVAWALAAGWNVLDFPAQRNSRALRLRECLPTGVRPNTAATEPGFACETVLHMLDCSRPWQTLPPADHPAPLTRSSFMRADTTWCCCMCSGSDGGADHAAGGTAGGRRRRARRWRSRRGAARGVAHGPLRRPAAGLLVVHWCAHLAHQSAEQC